MNLLLLLTALLTSLTGMMTGESRVVSRVQASAVVGAPVTDCQRVAAVTPATSRPSGIVANPRPLPLPRAFALIPALRLAAEQRRE